MRDFSASRCQGSVYIFEQLVSRSFSTRALNFDTLCHSEPQYPSIPVVCYSDASNYASLMALTIDESMPAKFPRVNASTRESGELLSREWSVVTLPRRATISRRNHFECRSIALHQMVKPDSQKTSCDRINFPCRGQAVSYGNRWTTINGTNTELISQMQNRNYV